MMEETDDKSNIESLKIASQKVIDIQRSGKLVQERSSDFFARVFNDLFPFGRGHPDDQRKVPVETGKCIQLYLRHSSRKFSKHPWFCLVAFDFILKKRALTRGLFTVKLSGNETKNIDRVTEDDLVEFFRQKAIQREKIEDSIPIDDSSQRENVNSVQKLLRKVELVCGSSFGTREERSSDIRKAWNLAN